MCSNNQYSSEKKEKTAKYHISTLLLTTVKFAVALNTKT